MSPNYKLISYSMKMPAYSSLICRNFHLHARRLCSLGSTSVWFHALFVHKVFSELQTSHSDPFTLDETQSVQPSIQNIKICQGNTVSPGPDKPPDMKMIFHAAMLLTEVVCKYILRKELAIRPL